MGEADTPTRPKVLQIPWMLGFCAFLAIALFFLWEEHRAHIFGAVAELDYRGYVHPMSWSPV